MLPNIFNLGNGALPSVQVFAMNIVCEAVASQRGEFLFVSVVANYTLSSASGDGVRVSQFEFECISGSWNRNVLNSPSVSVISDATFDSPLRRDCRVCILPSSIVADAGTYDNITHCLRKSTL